MYKFQDINVLDQNNINIFEASRPKLLGLAYRILGSLSDAEDAIQETFIKWTNARRENIQTPESWLVTVCTRYCIDQLRSAHYSRVNYVGAWLPEPIHTPIEHDTLHDAELSNSLSTAFLLMLERLSPKERAAYLLYEIFNVSYKEIAHTLQLEEANCRKLVSRAKANIGKTNIRHTTPLEKQEQFIDAFQLAITEGEISRLKDLLSNDITLSADGGGKVPTILEPIEGKEAVIHFMTKRLKNYWAGYYWNRIHINQQQGLNIQEQETITATVSFAYDDQDKVTHIFILRNPEKIKHLNTISSIH